MAMNYLEFSERLSGLKPSSIYLFTGEERFFIDEGVRAVRDRFLDAGLKDFNYNICYASDIGASKVVEIAETLPVMAQYRVVVIKGIDEWKAKEKEALLSYINRPSQTTCLVLTATKLDRREKFAAAVEKNGTVILCQPIYKQNLIKWIKEIVKRKGKGIETDALYMLTDSAGNDMYTLYNDIEKLVLYCGDRKNVSLKDVEMVSSNMRSVSVFEVVDAMADRRFKDAVFALKRAIDEGEPPVRVFYFIVREFRMILKASILIDAGESSERAATLAGVPAFKVKEFSQRIQKFSTKDLYNIFEKLIDIDRRLKGGAMRPAVVLEELLLFIL